MKLRNAITVSDLMQKCTSMFNTVADSIRKSDSENRSIRQTAFSFPTGKTNCISLVARPIWKFVDSIDLTDLCEWIILLTTRLKSLSIRLNKKHAM